MSVAVVDYGVGNLGSIRNMLKKIGASSALVSTPEALGEATRIILPGVGAFGHGMAQLRERGLLGALSERVLDAKVPLLGICLGMQLLTRGSEESDVEGLGWIDAQTRRFQFEGLGDDLKVPHMGWNRVASTEKNPLFEGLREGDRPRFYFCHSYHVVCRDPEAVMARTHHGYSFASAVGRDNVMGVQFHPEKSHRFGMRLLKNFFERL